MVKRAIFLILCLIFSHKVFAENDCKLISHLDRDLWLVDSTGKLIQRLSYDGLFKNTAAFSPDGQYIAYSSDSELGKEKAIVIVDNAGQEISKIIVEPQTEGPELQWIKSVYRLVWEKPNFLWSYSSVGRHGGFIDIWNLDSSLRGSHKKRLEVMGWGCEFSPNKQRVACIVEIFKIGMKESFLVLEINDTSKRKFPEYKVFFKDNYFSDSDPRTVELKQIERVDKIRFTPDNANVIIISGDRKYKFNMRDNKLTEIKELPPGVTIKSIPKMIRIKKDEKEYTVEVFDMYCGQDSAVPKL